MTADENPMKTISLAICSSIIVCGRHLLYHRQHYRRTSNGNYVGKSVDTFLPVSNFLSVIRDGLAVDNPSILSMKLLRKFRQDSH